MYLFLKHIPYYRTINGADKMFCNVLNSKMLPHMGLIPFPVESMTRPALAKSSNSRMSLHLTFGEILLLFATKLLEQMVPYLAPLLLKAPFYGFSMLKFVEVFT